MPADLQLKTNLQNDSGELVLRRATASDCDVAFAIQEASFRMYVDKEKGWDHEKERSQHDRNFDTFDYRVISLQDNVVGMISLDVSDDYIKLDRIFLSPENQGESIGENSMELLMSEAKRLDVPIRLQVMKVNPRAVAFYERLEFVVVEESDAHFSMEWRQQANSSASFQDTSCGDTPN